MAREDFGFQRRKGRGPRQQPTVASVKTRDDREPEPGDRVPESVFARMLKADRRVSRAIHDAVLDRGAVPRWALEALERAVPERALLLHGPTAHAPHALSFSRRQAHQADRCAAQSHVRLHDDVHCLCRASMKEKK